MDHGRVHRFDIFVDGHWTPIAGSNQYLKEIYEANRLSDERSYELCVYIIYVSCSLYLERI